VATANFAGSTVSSIGTNITLAAITGTAGTITSDGLKVTIPASGAIVTGGTMSGINIVSPTTSGPAAGTLYGMQIGNLTSAGSGTETAISIGTGWDEGLHVGGAFGAGLTEAVTPSAFGIGIRDANTFDTAGQAAMVIQKTGTWSQFDSALLRLEYNDTNSTNGYFLHMISEDASAGFIRASQNADATDSDVFTMFSDGRTSFVPSGDGAAIVITGTSITTANMMDFEKSKQ